MQVICEHKNITLGRYPEKFMLINIFKLLNLIKSRK